MRALGLNVSGYITSAAVAEDERVVAAVCEERLSRVKRDRAFPARAVTACLDAAGWAPDDLDEVVVAWNPAHHLARDLKMQDEANRGRARYLAYVPNALAGLFGATPAGETTQEILGRRIVYLDHHLAHAASACFTSPWQRGAMVTVDAFGEHDSLTIGRFADSRIEVLDRVRFPHSVGSFYSYVTEFLGFRADADEYKVMALAAYADPARGAALRERMRRLYRLTTDGGFRFEMDLSRFDHYLFDRPHDFGPLAEVLGLAPRAPGGELNDDHFAVAWALGRSFEDIVLRTLAYAQRLTGEPHAALAGGCFMNSVANGKLLDPTVRADAGGFHDVHIPPYPDDSGTAVGAALYATLHGRGGAHRAYRHNFFGPGIASEDAVRALRYRKVPFERVKDQAAAVAAAVADGELVAVAVGGMEFGQRALGHRSILADARDPHIRDKLNDSVKNRQWFRPYGVSVLAQRVDEVFDAGPRFRSAIRGHSSTGRFSSRYRVSSS